MLIPNLKIKLRKSAQIKINFDKTSIKQFFRITFFQDFYKMHKFEPNAEPIEPISSDAFLLIRCNLTTPARSCHFPISFRSIKRHCANKW